MATATPQRRALVDLPLNTFGTPSSIRTAGKENMGQKRQIQEVEEPESAPQFRVRVSPARSASTVMDDAELGPARTPSSMPHEPTTASSHMDEVMEEEEGDVASQNSCKDSTSSIGDFDPDDTMTSQQTVATELTQPVPSRVSQQAETLRLRLRLAHFKVRTNQTGIPLSQLQLIRQEAAPQCQALPSHPLLPPLPALLPAPVLRPTAYSARYTQTLSSPPRTTDNSPEHNAQYEVFKTPALPRQRDGDALRQTSSPPDSQERGSKREYRAEEDDLSSSAVRGKAAIGLLGLRRER